MNAKLHNQLRQGFTLVELAIVIVIAGVLAAVAIPIYRGLVDDSKFSEARMALGATRTALDVYRGKCSGKLPQVTAGPVTNVANIIGLSAQSFDLRYFDAADFTIVAVDTNAGTYTLRADGVNSTNAEAPRGIITVDEQGNMTGP